MNHSKMRRRIGGHLAELNLAESPQVTKESTPQPAVTDPHFWGHDPPGATRKDRP